jgi:hypothetical protein
MAEYPGDHLQDGDLLLGQSEKFEDVAVDLPVGRLNLMH